MLGHVARFLNNFFIDCPSYSVEGVDNKMFGLGKNRTRLGKFIDKHKISQGELAKGSGKSRNTISDLCDGNENVQANEETQFKIVGALRRMGHNVSVSDFW
jgi:putative transcriptional regulator